MVACVHFTAAVQLGATTSIRAKAPAVSASGDGTVSAPVSTGKMALMYECHGESRFDLIPLRGPQSIPRKR